jgi:hypothetical protein
MDGKQKRQEMRRTKDEAEDEGVGIEGISVERNDDGANVKNGRGEQSDTINRRLRAERHLF